MYQNSIILGTGIYHPANKVDNSFFIEHFKKYDINAEKLMNYLGRNTRYLSNDENESSLSMAIEASKDAMANAAVTPEELDMIVFVSDTPEYTSPSNALKINHELGAVNAHIVYDMNSNCIGMLTALDQISRYVRANTKIKKILVAGGLLISAVEREDDVVVYPNFADSGAAIILENAAEESPRGFIDSCYFTDSSYHNTVVMPKCGYSHIYKDNINTNEKKWSWNPFDFDFLSDRWADLIKELAETNNMVPMDIDHFIFSQFSKPDSEKTLQKLNLDMSKKTFIGDKYGYTGVTSPIFALNSFLKDNRVKEGYNIVMISVGTGYTMVALLYKF